MSAVLESLLAEPLPTDKNHDYAVGKCNVYYENRKVGCVHKVDLNKTINEIMQEKGLAFHLYLKVFQFFFTFYASSFFVTGGSLIFYIVPQNSRIEQEFIHEKRRNYFNK